MANFDPKRGKGISKAPKLFQAELADHLGVSRSVMCQALKEENAPKPVDGPNTRPKKLFYDKWEVEKWWKKRQKAKEITAQNT